MNRTSILFGCFALFYGICTMQQNRIIHADKIVLEHHRGHKVVIDSNGIVCTTSLAGIDVETSLTSGGLACKSLARNERKRLPTITEQNLDEMILHPGGWTCKQRTDQGSYGVRCESSGLVVFEGYLKTEDKLVLGRSDLAKLDGLSDTEYVIVVRRKDGQLKRIFDK